MFFNLFKKKNKPKEEKVTCAGCINLEYYNDGSVECIIGIKGDTLDFYNSQNIRPCKEERK